MRPIRQRQTKEQTVRILLVQPEGKQGRIGYRLAAMPEPLALELLAAMVPEHEVAILDMRLDKDLSGALNRFAPDVTVVTALTTEVYAAQEVLQTAKQYDPHVFTAVGGHHATLLPEDFFLSYVDAVCLGEGEQVFPQLIAALSKGQGPNSVPNLVWRDGDGGFVHNGRTVTGPDMNAVPQPRRDLTRQHRSEYFWLVSRPDSALATSRGCPYRCNFCSVWEFYNGQTRQMSVERVLDELRGIDTPFVTFMDDNFLMNYRRESAIAQCIKAEGIQHRYAMECRTDSIVRHPELIEQWAEIGLSGVLIGLEGASDGVLTSLNKKNTVQVNNEAIHILKANGILTWAAFLVDPDWTADDFDALYDYMGRMELTLMQCTVLTPLPGTQLYRDKYAQLLTHDYTCYDALHAVVPTRLPREEFYKRFARLYRQAEIRPYFDLVHRKILAKDDLKRWLTIGQAMSSWEFYAEGDPVLGGRTASGSPCPVPVRVHESL
jgi:radical SAM superfamily enzyme YgiQ (UPF0313 family)